MAGNVRLELDPARGVVLSGLPPILVEEEVRRHLTTGLTTTFLFRLEPQAQLAPAGARIEVRYELWDEVFHVTALTADGRLEQMVMSSLDELDSWWRKVGLLVLQDEARRRTTQRYVRSDMRLVSRAARAPAWPGC